MNQENQQMNPAGEGREMPEMPAMPPCSPGEAGSGIPEHPSLAMVYSPKQYWRNLYDVDEALPRGTLFRELDLPFFGEKVGDREE